MNFIQCVECGDTVGLCESWIIENHMGRIYERNLGLEFIIHGNYSALLSKKSRCDAVINSQPVNQALTPNL